MSNDAFNRAVEKVHQQRAEEAAREAAEQAKEREAKKQLEEQGPVWAKNLFTKLKENVLGSVINHPNTFSVVEDSDNSFGIDIEKKWQLKAGVADRTLTIRTLDSDRLQDDGLTTAPRYMGLECFYVEGQGWRWKKGTSMGNNKYAIGDISVGKPIDNAQLVTLFLARITDLMATKK